MPEEALTVPIININPPTAPKGHGGQGGKGEGMDQRLGANETNTIGGEGAGHVGGGCDV